jgi:AAA family ATP:ADP antiporter
MQKVGTLGRHFFDVRLGELPRTMCMFFYLLFVMFAYYILKPVSRAMFLNKFDIDKLPWLFILIAVFGGSLAYFYSKLAARTSLPTAVFWSMALSVICLIVIWYLLSLQIPDPKNPKRMIAKLQWMIYVFNVWVSLFSVSLVAQGWLVASNIFNAREAKRLYGLLGLGLVIGAWCGGEFTNQLARRIGTNNLLPAAAVMVVLAYIAFRLAMVQKGVSLAKARAVEGEVTDFSLREMIGDIARTRHLRVIIAIMVMIFIVDSLVDFQFQAMAQEVFEGDELTAYLGRFMGTYLNLIEFIFQFFLTTLVVGRFGVGGTLQIMPVSIALASLGTTLAPGLTSAAIARLTEASTRYTLNRTGLELLYLPLPLELRNRVKAFVDIFVDRMSRGIGGALLLLMFRLHAGDESGDVAPFVRIVAVVAIALTVPWVLLSMRARHEYVATIRKRLATRRLDLESARVTVEDREMITLLEQTAAGANPRQATYALSMLHEVPGYDLRPQLRALVAVPLDEVRGKVYEQARAIKFGALFEDALREIRSGGAATKAAIAYALAVSPDPGPLAEEWIGSPDHRLAEAAVEAYVAHSEDARDLISPEWIGARSCDTDPRRRALAARALGIAGDQGTEALHRLLQDPDRAVATIACRAAGELRNRAYVDALIQMLPNARMRGAAIEALAGYGSRICGTLGDILEDYTVPTRIRRHLPRVLKLIPDQRSVDVLLKAVLQQDLAIREAALKGLNRLRERAPHLHFEEGFIAPQIMTEARYYFELNAALEPFRNRTGGGARSAAELLTRSIEERLRKTLERLFRLLGLKYPPREIYSAYLAVNRRRVEEVSAALEFLDNVVERDLKRILIPLLDAPDHLARRGKELFGIEPRTVESAIRELIQSGDPWLVACAMAAAAELRLRGLTADIVQAARRAESEVSEVARAAQAALA